MNDGLELQMTIERVHIDIGDSVNITLTLKNVGNEALIARARDFTGGFATLLRTKHAFVLVYRLEQRQKSEHSRPLHSS